MRKKVQKRVVIRNTKPKFIRVHSGEFNFQFRDVSNFLSVESIHFKVAVLSDSIGILHWKMSENNSLRIKLNFVVLFS